MFSENSRLYEETETFSFKFPFNRNITIGFLVGTTVVLGLIMLLYLWDDIQPEPRSVTHDVIPVTLLNFGSGDGTGRSKGNLTAEGQAHKGQAPTTQINDAEIATNTNKSRNIAETDPTVSSNIKTVDNINSDNENKSNNTGNSVKNVGIADGDFDGTGLGSRGRGMGLGDGFGDIEWGGGGNRIVLSKRPPKFPTGAAAGEVRLKFRVKPDGTVSKIIILKKSDPMLENAAINALQQWRFNPIKDSTEMEGIIPFRFRLK